MDIYELSDVISNKNDFLIFLDEFKKSFSHNKDEWENDTLESFLEGFHGYCLDALEEEKLTWKIIAKILIASRTYE